LSEYFFFKSIGLTVFDGLFFGLGDAGFLAAHLSRMAVFCVGLHPVFIVLLNLNRPARACT